MATHQIVGGPSREELFDSLRLYAEKRVVIFYWKRDQYSGTIGADFFIDAIGAIFNPVTGRLEWRINCRTPKEEGGFWCATIQFDTNSRCGKMECDDNFA